MGWSLNMYGKSDRGRPTLRVRRAEVSHREKLSSTRFLKDMHSYVFVVLRNVVVL